MLISPIAPEDAPLLARPYYGDGDPGPIVTTLAQVPELLEKALPFIGATLGPSSIPWRTKEIVILRTSALLGCRFCVASHTPVALDSGLTHDQVRALRGERAAADLFAEQDDALIAWTDAVAGSGIPSDEVSKRIVAAFADHEVVELTLLVGCTVLLNRYATALRLPVSAATSERLAAEGMALA